MEPESISLYHEVLPVRDLGLTFRGDNGERWALEAGGLRLTPGKTAGGKAIALPEAGRQAGRAASVER